MTRRFRRPLAVATVSAAALVTAGPSLAAAAALTAPVIRESFTVQPCRGAPNNRTTVEEVACAEHQILATDATINVLNRAIFNALHDRPSRQDFVTGHRAWLRYRNAYCVSVSDQFRGGTEAGVLYAECAVAVNRAHIAELRVFARDLRPS